MSELPTKIDEMNIAQLRQYASQNRVATHKSMGEDELRRAIKAATEGQVRRLSATNSRERPDPGWARVEIDLERDPRASNADVYVQVNGFAGLIKRGVEADVPIKFVEALRNAKMEVMREDATRAVNDPERYKFEMVFSYPFHVLDINEGPDPRPVLEAVAARRSAPRRRFREKNGFWPKPAELKEWLSNGGDKDKK
jgi:hypothetical protein